MDTAQQIREAAERGRKSVDSLRAEFDQMQQAHDDELRRDWESFVANLRNGGMPAWAVEYINEQNCWYEHASSRAHVGRTRIDLPGCAPILVSIGMKGALAHFQVVEPIAVEYEADYGDRWIVKTSTQPIADPHDFDVAVAQAEAWGESYHEMATEAARRNAQGIVPAPRPTLRHRIATVDPAEQIVNILDGMLHTQAEAGPLWAALSIGMELRGIRTALEDIASALLEPVDDPLITE